MSLFYAPRPVENYQNDEGASITLKTLINNEAIAKMNDEEWARYLAEVVYILWFQIFTTTLPMYPQHAKELISFCKRLLSHLSRKLKPMKDIEIVYRRLFEACGTCRLQEEILDLYTDMKKNKIDPDKVTFGTYYQAFQVSKKPVANPNQVGPFAALSQATQDEIHGLRGKESYLKYAPEEYQKRLQEFQTQS